MSSRQYSSPQLNTSMDQEISPQQTTIDAARFELASLEAKINAILPPRYIGCFEDVSPKSMGSATLKYDRDGKVAWGEIWTTFCHLALAGGPPHRGRLLDAVPTSEALSHPKEQAAVVDEIKRAIRLSSQLPTTEDQPPGWVGVQCHDEDMAAWLVRAIVAENVMARQEASVLYVPAGPQFRVEKEIKNVVVCVAKTSHYLLDHVEPDERPRGLDRDPIRPPLPDEIAASPEAYQAAAENLRQRLSTQSEMKVIPSESPGWIGIECVSEEMAVWMQRAIVVHDVLARRESNVLFVPVSISSESSAAHEKLQRVVNDSHRLWKVHASKQSE